jgi:translation initiation factor IF-1
VDEASRSAAHDVTGVVAEVLPSALYRVRLDAGVMVTAHGGPGAGGTVVNFVRLVVGDRVRIELSPVDPGRGRIVQRLQG